METNSENVKLLPINKIKLARNSRQLFSDESIAQLMQSIKEVGLLQPIGVNKVNGGYEICYGNCRFLACSKLGMSTIPAVIHHDTDPAIFDLKNLTENVQRKNITPMEVGRYINLLENQGLTRAEIAVRLGVAKSYVEACIEAFGSVPKEYQNDLEMRVGAAAGKGGKRSLGKISMRATRAILNLSKSGIITNTEKYDLFRLAKSPGFNEKNVTDYLGALRKGSSNPLALKSKLKRRIFYYWMADDEYYSLKEKFVRKGIFKNVNQYLIAILRGEKRGSVNIK